VAKFSTPVQTGLGTHPASYTMATGSFLGVQQLGYDTDHPPLSSAKVKERVELYLYFPLWAFVASSSVNFTFYLYCRSVWDWEIEELTIFKCLFMCKNDNNLHFLVTRNFWTSRMLQGSISAVTVANTITVVTLEEPTPHRGFVVCTKHRKMLPTV